MNLDPSDYIALGALLMSFVSLGMSLYTGFLDKPRLSAWATYFSVHEDYGQARIRVQIVNRGRRPAIIRTFGGTLETGRWNVQYLGEKDQGLRLSENGFHELMISHDEVYTSRPDCDSRFVDFWFEDSLGRRHIVKQSANAITSLLRAYGDEI